jgi:hypothetical protein
MASERNLHIKPLGWMLLAGICISTQGCAVGGRSAQGSPCHFGCRPSSRESHPGTIPLNFLYSTQFDRSIRVSVDNFMSRYQADHQDPQIDAWVTAFLRPGERILGETLRYDPVVNYKIEPRSTRVSFESSWSNNLLVNNGELGFDRLVSLVSADPSDVLRLEWRVIFGGLVEFSGERDITYGLFLDIELKPTYKADTHHARTTTDVASSVEEFRRDLSAKLYSTYFRLFQERYGLTLRESPGDEASPVQGREY